MVHDGAGTGADGEFALERAKAAAAAGEPLEMVTWLFRSFFLDGLTRSLEAKWPGLDAGDVQIAVSQAVDDAYEALRSGKKIFNLKAWLYKVADRKAYARNESRRESVGKKGDVAELAAGSAGQEIDEDDETRRDERRAQLRGRAIAVARSLLPRLGQDKVRAVMAYILDAVEAGKPDVTAPEIAQALGLGAATVRVHILRGFRRLARLARDEGLGDIDGVLPTDSRDHDPDDEDEDDQ